MYQKGENMYQVYIKTETGFERKKLIGKSSDYAEAYGLVEAELSKNKDLKYVIEETNGRVDIYGELIIDVIDEN